MLVKFYPSHAQNVGRQFNITLNQGAHLVAPEATDKVSKLQNYILARSGTLRTIFKTADVVGSDKHHGKAYVAVRFEFLNDGSPLICLLVEDDGLQAKFKEKSSDGVLNSAMAMHNEDLAAEGSWRSCRR